MGELAHAPQTDLVERMVVALNGAFVPLSCEADCHAAYRAAGIRSYTQADHETAWEEALLSRCFVASAERRLKLLPPGAGEGEV